MQRESPDTRPRVSLGSTGVIFVLRMMTTGLSKLTKKIGKALLVISLILAPLIVSAAQLQQKKALPDDPTKPEKEELTVAEEELKAKRAIKEEDREYQENLGRARNLSSLGSEIVSSFKQKNALDQDDIKKLEKVEKLTKGIRRAAGGSEDKVEMEKPPKDLVTAMEMFGDVSQSLKQKVEKTPKHVISANVIDEANVLLELIRIVRSLPAKV